MYPRAVFALFPSLLLLATLFSPVLAENNSSTYSLLNEGDYAIYIGVLPEIVSKKKENIVFYTSPILGEVKPGPWLVEWCVVKDYSDVDVVLVHVYYRLAERVAKTETEEGRGDHLLLAVPSRPDRRHLLVERDRVFLVVLDKKRNAIIDSNGSIVVSWIYTLGARGFEVASRLASGRNLSTGIPLVIPSYYVDESPAYRRSFLASIRNNTYIVFSPRAIISGPYTVFRAEWAPLLKDLNSSSLNATVPSSVAGVVQKLLSSSSAPSEVLASMRVVFFSSVYEASRGVLLLYDTYVDPLVLLAEDFNATRVFIDERVLDYADAVVLSKEVGSLLKKLGGSMYISHGLMFLYNSSLLDPGERRKAVLHPPSSIRVLVDYALSKSLFARGCKPESLRALDASFIGGWSWSLLEERYAASTSATSSASTTSLQPTASSLVQRGGESSLLVLMALSAIVIGLGVGLVLYEKRVSSRAR